MRDRVIAAVGDAYLVESELGRGGMAIVYRASDARLHRPVAIKVLPPEFAFRPNVRSRFLREAQTAAQLNHAAIVPIYTVGEGEGLVYFVMAFVDGETLAERIARAPVGIDEARRILCDVADALICAHAHGVIHRDIKPDNIMLDRATGRAMVTDFGIARAAEADSRLTATGMAVGTPAYMSPEQGMGDRELDGRSDIYSLGVVGFQLLAGELPYRAANTPAMIMKHVSETPRPLREVRPDVPSALDYAIDRALAKRPEDRWPSASAFRDALTATEEPAVPWRHAALPRAQPARSAPPAPDVPDPGGALPPGVPPRDWKSYAPEWKSYASKARASGMLVGPPAPPPGLSRRERKEFFREYYRSVRHAQGEIMRAPRPLDVRIVSFRRSLASTVATTVMLAGINLLTSPQFPWFLIPALGMGIPVMRQWGRLWADGVSWSCIFGRDRVVLAEASQPAHPALPAAAPAAPTLSATEEAAAKMAPAEVLGGPYGPAVRRAAGDRLTALAIVESLARPDRELIPDVAPTVNALADRAAALAQTLHHLDADVSPDAMSRLETRITEVRRESESSADHQRRLSLLERQYGTLVELSRRRTRLQGQLDSAAIALQNLKLDLLRLRSSGVQSALADVNSATVEARALSREIGHVLHAANEVRNL